jgi:LysM repeat protein
VRKGDTISGIAERYGLTSDWILRLNPQVDPVSLAVGTRLNLREPAAP